MQLAPRSEAAGASVEQLAPRPPSPLTRLIGRERELASVDELLQDARLLTLKGAGGSGKTRLAGELARRVAHRFEGGAVWIELATLADPELVAPHLAAELGARQQPERSAFESLLGVISSRPMLLVLDNCEHLVEACASLVERLLRACPGLTVLATSRESLGVPGETAWTIPPLALPRVHADSTPGEIASSEAVQLFLERARGVLPSFELNAGNAHAVARICEHLNGMPLAIELAAARIQVLSPEQIAERLEDALHLLTSGPRVTEPRHRTLRAAIDWSYQLLNGEERRLFDRLAVFPGAFALEAAEEVCSGDPIRADQVLDLLASLVDRSLVGVEEYGGTVRYRLLETMRQYGLERLRDAAEESLVRRRHARHVQALLKEGEPHLMLADGRWIDRIAHEYPNFRAALSWSFGPDGDVDTGIALAASLRWFWYYTIRWAEARGWIEKALAVATREHHARERAGLLRLAGTIAWYGGESATALDQLTESEALWRQIGDERQLAFTLSSLAQLLSRDGGAEASHAGPGDRSRAQRVAEEALRLARRGGEGHDIAYVLTNSIADLAFARHDYAAADAALAEAELIWRGKNDPRGIALVLNGRARIALRQGDLGRADELARKALAPRGELPDEWFGSRALRTLAYVALRRGAAADAVGWLGAASTLVARIGATPPGDERTEFEQALDEARALLSPEEFTRAWDSGSRLTLADASRLSPRDESSIPDGQDATPARTLEELPDTSSPPAAARLRVNALGPLQIFRNGRRLEAEAWGPAKPRELLLYLLCHPDGCTKDQIGVALWPDSSSSQVRNNFHTALHRLRRTLGDGDWITFAGDRYRIDPEIPCTFDVALFEQTVTATLRTARTGPLDPAALGEGLQLYRGHFLDGEVVGDWHLQIRDRLQRLYLEGQRALAEHWMSAGKDAEAADAYRRIVYQDDLDEEAYRGLMTCYARLGERTRALRLYHQLVELLRVELETEPEPETVALFESLQGG